MKRRSEELNEYLTTIKNENVLLGKLLYKLNNQLSSFKCYQYSKEIEKLLNRSIKEIEQWKTPTLEVMESMNDNFITIINKIEDLGLDLMALVNLNYHLQFGCMVISMMSRIHTCLKGAYAIIEERIAEKRSTIKKTESVVITEVKKSTTTVTTTNTAKPVVENKPNVVVAEKKTTTTAMVIEEKKAESVIESKPAPKEEVKPVEVIVEEKPVEEVKEEVKVVEVEAIVEQEIKPAKIQEEEVKLERLEKTIQMEEEIVIEQKPEEVIEVQKEVEIEYQQKLQEENLPKQVEPIVTEEQQKPQEEKKAEPINTEARGIIGASYLAEHPVENEKKSKVSEVKPLVQEINLGGQPENQMSIKIAEMKINTLFVSKQRDRRKLQNTAIAIEPVVQQEEPPQEEKVQEPVEEKEGIKKKPAGFSYSDIQQDLQKELGIQVPAVPAVSVPEPIQIEEVKEAEVEEVEEENSNIEAEIENENVEEEEWLGEEGEEEDEAKPRVERQGRKLTKHHRRRALGPLKKFRKIRDYLGRLVKIVQE